MAKRKKSKIEEMIVVVPLADVTDSEMESTESVLNSVDYWNAHDRDGRTMDVLLDAQRCYWNMATWRQRRERAKNFTYDNQYRDIVEVDGKKMSEEQYILEGGLVPLSNNLIRRLVNNVVGTYLGQDKEPTCSSRDKNEQVYAETDSTLLQYNRQLNKAGLLYSEALQEALFSAFVAMKHTYGYNESKHIIDCWQYKCDMSRFVMDSDARDVRGWDVRLIGELHDLTLQEVCATFASNPIQVAEIQKEYKYTTDREYLRHTCNRFGESDLRNFDFLSAAEAGRCRVIEIWNKETRQMARFWDKAKGEIFICKVTDIPVLVDNVNQRRMFEAERAGLDPQKIALIVPAVDNTTDGNGWFIENYWYYRFVTPSGKVLKEGETPYAHGEHPYTFFAYPFIDGELHSFVDTVIDQQKFVNSLITMQRWIMKNSAKGVLLAPESAFEGHDINEVAEQWSRFDGLILYRAKAGVPMPTQISANSTNIGIHELLATEMKLFEDISGVNGALQGKAGYSSTSGALYAQQVQNGTTSLLDILMSYSEFVVDGAYKTLKNILQFYPDEKVLEIVGEEAQRKGFSIDRWRNVETDISIVESQSTPAYRMVAENFLVDLAKMGVLNGEQYLELSGMPFAEKARNKVQADQAAMQQQMMAQQQGQGQMQGA